MMYLIILYLKNKKVVETETDDIFEEEGFKIEDVDDEYNPTFLITFKYEDEHQYISEKLSLALGLIHEAMEKAFNDIEGKEEEYK